MDAPQRAGLRARFGASDQTITTTTTQGGGTQNALEEKNAIIMQYFTVDHQSFNGKQLAGNSN